MASSLANLAGITASARERFAIFIGSSQNKKPTSPSVKGSSGKKEKVGHDVINSKSNCEIGKDFSWFKYKRAKSFAKIWPASYPLQTTPNDNFKLWLNIVSQTL